MSSGHNYPASSLLAVLAVLASDASAAAWFEDAALRLGVTFRHVNGATGQFYFVETAAGGGGWLDFDDDGDLDLYLVNGAVLGSAPDAGSPPVAANALYENRDGVFVDVSATAGVADPGYGMGLCVGDYDGDDRIDMFVTNVGADRLYRNLGNGRFVDVASAAGVAGQGWSTGCSFGDIDGDGDLDLYVARYVEFSPAGHHPECGEARSGPAYCAPSHYEGLPDALYINQGNGLFRDEATRRGIASAATERGFGALFSDLDGDGDLDLLVANDGTPNRYYRNDGGQFHDYGLESGLAVDEAGRSLAGMGLDVGDVDGDGRWDVGVTNFAYEPHTLHRGLAGGLFRDISRAAGLSRATHSYVGWGIQFADFDNDADLDLVIANGHVQTGIGEIEPMLSYAQPDQLFINGDDGWADASAMLASAQTQPRSSRGLAVGDYNNDGRPDVLITHVNAAPRLLNNQHPGAGRWLGVRLRGPRGNRAAIGARIEVTSAAGAMIREVRSGGSYLSQNDLRAHFGLGAQPGRVSLRVRWPDGLHTTHAAPELDRYLLIIHPGASKP